MNEMDAGASEAGHRLVIVIVIRCEFDAMLHVLVGYGAGEKYVFHFIQIIPLAAPLALVAALMLRSEIQPPMVQC